MEDLKRVTMDSGEPSISFHSITGKLHANTMQLQVVIDKELLLSLVDSTVHTILLATAAQCLDLPVQHQGYLYVSLANGEKISNLAISTTLQFCVAKHSFSVDIYVIPQDDFDVVLGIKWLQTLGPVFLLLY